MSSSRMTPGVYVLPVGITNPMGDRRYVYDWARRPALLSGCRFEVAAPTPETLEALGVESPSVDAQAVYGIRYLDPTQPERHAFIWSTDTAYARRIVQEAAADPQRSAAAHSVATVLAAGEAPIVIRFP